MNVSIDNKTNVDQKTMLDTLKRSMVTLLPSGASVLLFGSRARGTHRPDSDWDLLVLLNRDGRSTWEDYDNVGYPLNMLFWSLGQDVNTIIQTREEWKQKHFTPFYKNVMEDAIVLV
ncbi:MAG: nucleotidyltransferase domain-containing protein [Bacteroidales bacterium]|nr:nucleotidyltransferase domain-containing protein [Bacteroidales bacterium]